MAFISVLISLFIERLLGSMESMRRFGWFEAYGRWLRRHLPESGPWDGPLGVLILMGAPVLAVTLLSYFISGIWLPLGFIFAVFMLLYSYGPRDLEAEVEAFVDARERGDEESAEWYAASLLEGDRPENSHALMRTLMEHIFVETNERLLGVIFWFVVLGPTGAILYRLSCQEKFNQRDHDDGFAVSVRHLHDILAWVPARICALGYALGGSFEDAIFAWRKESDDWSDHTRGVLISSGFGALQKDRWNGAEKAHPEMSTEDIKATVTLVKRTQLVCLAILALLTLAGWLG
jgi:membrane protein required for beta-lactamase induction